MRTEEPIRVVIAEDDYLVAREIARAVSDLGYEIVGDAANGEEAVKLACQARPDVVLMDIQMPLLDGLTATARIQQQCPTPVVILTAHDSHHTLQLAGKVGVAAFLTKPPDGRQIEQAITIALARFQDMTEIVRLNRELERHNRELQDALERIDTLEGLLPICSGCKMIRNEDGGWTAIEAYLSKRTRAGFTHGICPKCAKTLYPELTSSSD